ncbi:MAG: translocation/assembly module TamB domain-containing protein [Burkholderiaceae bacterium]|nr:translocation/assembly module TamB domain-containing protein [Burkholderiaceae bacterium]
MVARDVSRWGMRALGVALAVLLLIVTGAVWWVGQSTSFLRWSLERAVAASGGALEAGAVRGTLLGGFRIESMHWHDAARDLQLEGLVVSLRPAALLHGEVRVGRIEIAQARVVLQPGADADPPAPPQSLELPIDVRIDALGIGRLAILPDATAGEPIVLERVSFAGRYRNGAYRIDRLAAASPAWGEASVQGTLAARAPFDLEAMIEATPRLALAAQPSLSLPDVRALADGTLEDFSLVAQALPPAGVSTRVWIGLDTRVQPFAAKLSEKLAPVELRFDSVEPAQFGLHDVPDARISGSATLRVRDEGFEGGFRLENARPGPLDRDAVPLQTLQGAFDWTASVLRLSGLRATLPGGTNAQATATAGAAGGASVGRTPDAAMGAGATTIAGAGFEATLAIDFAQSLEAFGVRLPMVRGEGRLHDVDLSQLHTQLDETRLGGTLRVDGDRLELDVADASREDIGVTASLRIEADRLRIERARLRSAAGSLEVSGSTSTSSPWHVDLAGRFERLDPARIEALLARLGVLGAPPRLQQWGGKLGGRWTARGRAWPDPSLETSLAVESGVLAGRDLRLHWRGDVTPTRIAKVEATLDYGGAQAQASGALGRPGDRLQFRVRVPALQRFDARASGSASAQGELRGGWRDAALGVAARISARGIGWEEALRVGSLEGRIDLPDLSGGRVDVDLTAKRLAANGRRIERASIRAEGDLDAHTVRVDVVGPDVAARASAEGSLARPDAGSGWRWQGRLLRVEADRPIALRLLDPAQAQADEHGFSLGASSWRLDGAALNVAALAWRDGSYTARGDAAALPVGRWVLRHAPEAADAVEAAEAEIAKLSLDAQWDVHGDDPMRPSGRVRLVLQSGSAGEQRGEASVVLDEGRLGGRVTLNVPTLAFANRIIGPTWAVAGRLRFAGDLGGTIDAPRVTGDLDGRSLALSQRELGWRLTDGTLHARFEGDRLVLDQLRLESGEGSITMSGALLLDGLRGDFALRADRLPIPLGPGERIVVSGTNAITSRGTELQWSGEMRVDEGLVELRGGEAPRLPDDVVIVGEGEHASAAQKSTATEEAGAAEQADGLRVAADLKLDLGEKLRVRGSGVDVLLAGSLALRGVLPDKPLAYGTVRVAKGTYSAYGQELQITRGRVIFDGPIDNPVLDIVAMRLGTPVKAGVAVTGTVLSPRVQLVSEPDVPDAEKLSWLVLGVGFDDARSGAQMAALRAAAASLMGSGGGAGVSAGLAHSLGLDVLTIRSASSGDVFDPDFGATFPGQSPTGTPAPTAAQNVVAIGKRLGSRVLVTYEQGLRGVWNLLRIQYEITDRLSLRAQTGTDTALDLLYSFSFD